MTTRFNDNDLLIIVSRYNPVPSAAKHPGMSTRRGLSIKEIQVGTPPDKAGGSPGARSRFLPEVIPSLGYTVSTEMCFSFLPSLEVSCKDQREMEARVKRGDFDQLTQVFDYWLKEFFPTKNADSCGNSNVFRLFGPTGRSRLDGMWSNAQEIDAFPNDEKSGKKSGKKTIDISSWFEWLTV